MSGEPTDGVTFEENPGPPRSTSVLPGLTLLGVLGEGGMGRVHEAQEDHLLRRVAVKTARDPRFAAQLEREGLVLSALEHPNIVPVYALRPGPQLVLRKIGGTTWDDLIYDTGRAELAARGEGVLAFHVRVLMAVCDAVAHAHTRRILHRDLKPENVMVGEHGQIYLLDWGLAVSLDPGDTRPIPRASQLQGISGTPAYMAPEQAVAGVLDERTDVYGLGAILHEILTRTPRNPGDGAKAMLKSAAAPHEVQYPEDVDELLGALANRMTASAPTERPASASEVRAALVQWQEFRVSVDLTRRAKEQIKIVRRARKAEGPTPLVLSLLTESASTLRQALDIWPGNARADGALQRILREEFEAQITLGNLEMAEDALSELDDPGDLQGRLEAARSEAVREAKTVDALKRSAAENSFRADWRWRSGSGLLGTVGVGGLCAVIALVDRLYGPIGYGAVLVGVGIFDAMMLLATGSTIVRGNRRSRRIAGQFAGMAVAITAHWLGATWMGLSMQTALAWNCLVAGGLLFAGGAASTDRAGVAASLPYALGFVGITVLPVLFWEQYALATAASFAVWTVLQPWAGDADPIS